MLRTAAKITNVALVLLGLLIAVIPAVAIHTMTAVMLVVATPALWAAYFAGWWGLISLLRIFASFVREAVSVGPMTILGVVAGSVAILAILWQAFAQSPNCSTCAPFDLFVYRPELLCIFVGAHWLVLRSRGFRLSRGRAASAA